MFTGIVEELGELVSATRRGATVRLAVRGKLVTSDARHGDSIAVNGVCLTVVDVAEDVFEVDVIDETLSRTSLRDLGAGAPINLERALRADARLGGHIMQGHVDGTGTIVSHSPDHVVRISLPSTLSRYVVEKGSIAVDGVSLTVSWVGDEAFEVSLIPATLALTNLGAKQVGEPVNLEVDIVAKYVEKLISR
ncbi:riboflavin synthase [Rhizohabitans arisaemae]|uniref:riboflavin synthase n=1 Tax=Rhizohabitans arisaemae TaxID=2720610 RepID=UPI0024B1078F|nr:riboflavin synthase [Rhizohabitans arisaemae]